MRGLILSSKVQEKLASKEPPVTRGEIEECFANRTGVYLLDQREQHKSDLPTQWFIAETDYGRKLKICFLQYEDKIVIRTAYDPNAEELRIYAKYGS